MKKSSESWRFQSSSNGPIEVVTKLQNSVNDRSQSTLKNLRRRSTMNNRVFDDCRYLAWMITARIINHQLSIISYTADQ